MKEIIKKYLSEFKIGTKTMFKEFFNKETNKKQRANMWTFSRLILTLPILIFSIISIISFSAPLLIANSILVSIGAITDYFDGKSARKHKSTSEYGKKLDQIVDKVFSIVIGVTLAIINPLYLIPLLGEGIIMSCNIPFSIKYKNLNDSSSLIGRIKQWPLGIAFILGYISSLTTGLSIAATISVIVTFMFQVVTALTYLKRNIDGVKKIENEERDNKLLEITEDFEKNSELVKTLGEKEINSNVDCVTKSKQELINELKVTKDELLHNDEKYNIIEKENYQKSKKL